MLKEIAIDLLHHISAWKPKRVREWKKDIEKIKSTKANRQRVEGGGRKCIDEDLGRGFSTLDL